MLRFLVWSSPVKGRRATAGGVPPRGVGGLGALQIVLLQPIPEGVTDPTFAGLHDTHRETNEKLATSEIEYRHNCAIERGAGCEPGRPVVPAGAGERHGPGDGPGRAAGGTGAVAGRIYVAGRPGGADGGEHRGGADGRRGLGGERGRAVREPARG